MSELFLSVIIPAYNEERRLPNTLEQLCTFLDAQPFTSEVLIVENGSQDHTLEIAKAFAKSCSRVRVFQNTKRGKGLAVQLGMREARGIYRLMADVDFSMPVPEINRFIPPGLTDFDIAIASREAPGAVRYNEPLYRHIIGRGYNILIRLLALPGLQDTQCGFKCFRGEVADDLFDYQTLPGWSFDVELLYIARLHGYRIVEIPIPWYFNSESKVSVLRDSLHMGLDLLKIRWNSARGVYEKKA